MRRLWFLASSVLLAAACGGGDGNKSAASSTTSAEAQTTLSPSTTGGAATTVAPGAVTLHAYNVRLFNSEESDNGFRVQIHSADSTVTVVLKGGIPSPNQVVNVCSTPDIDSHGSSSTCISPSDGQVMRVAHGEGRRAIEVIQVGVQNAPGGDGSSVTINEIEIAYVPSDPSAEVRLPSIEVPLGASVCKDNGCNPFFEVTPFKAGMVSATAKWQGTDNAALTLETGDIAAHGQAATGQFYNVISTASGGPNLSVNSTVPASEWSIAFRNTGASPVIGAKLSLSWP